ncbi:hypothetical protein IC235_06430 [Hymenobacter sp. BT664]|uniref:Uncharacterized protein n=1 Tax=Hymenobacter montanus TaxID=2771359 RepID=A0A927BB62_9BACT|nr:hypothetical protein [Hymenobacter montanus]MBD2767525.1 hypothetical protein [Hymenobacter montanus]
MDFERIKILRQTISVPLDRATELIRNNNGDLLACQQEFHISTIKDISNITECDEETAREVYKICNYDKAKAIERIHARKVIITTREDKVRKNEIGFILWPEDRNGEGYKIIKRDDIFIPINDFEYAIHCFRSVFPLQDPWDKSREECFDCCGYNHFDAETCRQIVERVNRIKAGDPKVMRFLQELIQWFDDKLKYADYIVVYGNL